MEKINLEHMFEGAMTVPLVENTCKYCGKIFLVQKKELDRGNGIYCSRSCVASARNISANVIFYRDLLYRQCDVDDIGTKDGNYIAGLVDGEGSFVIVKDEATNRLRANFKVDLTLKDKDILEWMQVIFNVGHSYYLFQRTRNSKPAFRFVVNDLGNIVSRVIPFFEKFPLQGKKAQDFQRFTIIINDFIKEAAEGKRNVTRFTNEVAKLNNEYIRGDTNEVASLDGHYLAGLVDGEGSFLVKVSRDLTLNCGYRVKPTFSIQLTEMDYPLLVRVQKTLNCGTVRIQKRDRIAEYAVQSIKVIRNEIIPFFEQYCLRAKKREDFIHFKQVLHLCEQKKHLEKDGVKQILTIRENMNDGGAPNRKKYLLGE